MRLAFLYPIAVLPTIKGKVHNSHGLALQFGQSSAFLKNWEYVIQFFGCSL